MHKFKLLIVGLLVVLISVFAYTKIKGASQQKLTIHFQSYKTEASKLGFHLWGEKEAKFTITKASNEGLRGMKLELTYEVDAKIGFIPVAEVKTGALKADKTIALWDNVEKLTALVKGKTNDYENAYIDTKGFAADTEILMFEGVGAKGLDEKFLKVFPQKDFFVIDKAAINEFVFYYSAVNDYSDKLGFHLWGTGLIPAPQWGEPAKLLNTVGTYEGNVILVAHLKRAANDDMGIILYEGGDETKRLNDYKLKPEVELKNGDFKITYVYDIGYSTENKNVYTADKIAEFEKKGMVFIYAFKKYDLKITDILDNKNQKKGEKYVLDGTYAKDPKTIFAVLNRGYKFPQGTTIEQIVEQTKSFFKLSEVVKEGETITKTPVEIKDINFATTGNDGEIAPFSFVLLPKTDLDITKTYNVEYDNSKLPGMDPKKAITVNIDLVLDTEKPQLTFIDEGLLNKKPEDRIIEINVNTQYNQNLFPRYEVKDTRDGDLTRMVYVPADTEFKTLNLNKKGDYKILLRVEDNWGHVTEETFIFRVK